MHMTPDQRGPAPARAARALGPAPVLFACLFAAQAAFLTLAPILPELASEFDVSTATAGQLETVAGLSGGLTAVAIAVLGGRVVVRQLLPAGLALLAAGSLGSALAPSFALLLVAPSFFLAPACRR
jgi:DHA1 family inner membrane transport protein